MSPEEIHFIQQAVIFVSEHGWQFLPEYIFYEDTGEWRHKSIKNKKPFRRWLNDIHFDNGALEYPVKGHTVQNISTSLSSLFELYLEQATTRLLITLKRIMSPTYAVSDYQTGSVNNEESPLISEYRWYVTRIEAYQDIVDGYTPAGNNNILEGVLVHVKQRRNIKEEEEEKEEVTKEEEEEEEEEELVEEEEVIVENKSLKRAADQLSISTVSPVSPLPTISASNPFMVHVGDKKIRREIRKESCLSESGKEVMPLSVVDMIQEEGVQFEYRTGVNGTLEYTAIVPGLDFKERVQIMKKRKDLYPDVPTRIMKLIGQGIGHYEMLKEGDRVMLGLSGGKDSLTMLHCLLQLQRRSPVKFELACVTVDPQTTGFDPSPLRDYCKQLGVKYFYESRAVIALAKNKMVNGSICSWCSRMKRGILYATMRREGYNVLVLAQHLDDLAESFLMSVFHNGVLRTMKACYNNMQQDVRVIRPFVYVREKMLREFAKTMNLPIIDENCPACFEGNRPKERYRMKTLLAAEENLFPNVFNCILSAMIPLMKYNSAIGCAMEWDSFTVFMDRRDTPREMRGKCHVSRLERGNDGNKKTEEIEEDVDEDEDEF